MEVLAAIIAAVLLVALLLFWPAGTPYWTEGWIVLGLFLAQLIINTALLKRWSPGLIQERMHPGPGVKPWDKVVLPFFGAEMLGIFLVAGLDHRYGWSPPLGLTGPAVVMHVVGATFFTWAMVANPFFSKVVRIQEDRGHRVIRTGPYQMVRHPGYLGFLIQWASVPAILNSLWALVPYFLTTVTLIVRTYLEDETLAKELPGYLDYRREVRFRLLPGLW